MTRFAPLLLAAYALTASAAPTLPHGVVSLEDRAGAPINDINITVTPEEVTQCATVSVEFDGGVSPYTLKIGTGGYYIPNSKWLYQFDDAPSPFQWAVNVSVGTSLNFQVFDAAGQTKNVQNLVVGKGESTSCIRCKAKSNK